MYLMSADGRRLVSLEALGVAYPGDWSPDGRRIVFTHADPDGLRVRIANADGSGAVRLTASIGSANDPRWSPDGHTITYTDTSDPLNWGINAVNVDGTGDHRLPSTSRNRGDHDWSPDGTHIVFGRGEAVPIPGTSEYRAVTSLFITDSSGTELVRLTRDTTCDDMDPAWSPDGRKIAFESCADGKYRIYVIDARGGTATALTSGDAPDYAPTWSPDSRRIAFQRGSRSDVDVWVMSADGSGQVNLTADRIGFDGWPRWWRPTVPRRD